MKTTFSKDSIMLKTLLMAAITMLLASPAMADWSFPITAIGGSVKTTLTLGQADKATDGYDRGFDAPTPFEGETLYAYFPHIAWNVTIAGQPNPNFCRDIRGGFPQNYTFEVKSTLSSLTLQWNSAAVPAGIALVLTDQTSGQSIDMTTTGQYSFSGSTTSRAFVVKATAGDTTPPAAPTGLNVILKDNSIFLSWASNSEADLAGYKIHLGSESGSFYKSIDLKNVNNYNLFNIALEKPYYLALSAYDKAGNESTLSETQTAMVSASNGTPPGTQNPGTDGDLDGDGLVSIADALRALRISAGIVQPTSADLSHGDVAPLVNGVPHPDKVIDIGDVIVTLRRAVGLLSW